MGDDLTGRTLLGRYAVQERIAAGGMSVVYAGQDQRLQRPVCVKVLVGIATSDLYQTLYEHFVQEAFALSQLQHPNTLRIYDFGYLDEQTKTPFFVLELITGGTLLQQVKRSGPLTPEAAVDVLEPIVHALAEAHARGIVHRDIKPSNILFSEVGEERIPKLADFGIAKMRSGPGKAADTKGTSGPPISLYSAGWAAPEQMRKKPVGPTADVYSLGLLLAFALTGKKVFPDDDNVVQTLAHRIEGNEFVGDTLGKMELPPPIREVIARACRVDPAERHQTAPDFLRAAREAVQALASPPPLPSARPPTTAGGAVLRVSNISEPQDPRRRPAGGAGPVRRDGGPGRGGLSGLDAGAGALHLRARPVPDAAAAREGPELLRRQGGRPAHQRRGGGQGLAAPPPDAAGATADAGLGALPVRAAGRPVGLPVPGRGRRDPGGAAGAGGLRGPARLRSGAGAGPALFAPGVSPW